MFNTFTFFSNAYKCAVFFEDLTPKRKHTWIGALPDALKKAKNQEEIDEILGDNVNEASFKQLTTCDETTANARCYAIVSLNNSTHFAGVGLKMGSLF